MARLSRFLLQALTGVSLIKAGASSQINKGGRLGQTPQMGWNSWNAFKAEYDISQIKQTVQKFQDLGLKDAGYEHVILDEGWQAKERTSDGYLQSNETSFPGGMKQLADYIHSHDLKMGLYGDSGILTCGFNPGSWGYEQRDALSLAGWEVDYWKYDNCGGFQSMVNAPQVRFGTMRDALLQSGRDIFYSLCEWGFQFPWHWGGNIGHSYRMSGDITAKFTNETGCDCKTAYCLNTGYAGCSVLSIIRKMREISHYQTPGHWLDMDILEIGNANMTLFMEQTHFAFWAALKSPLIISTDLSKLNKDSVSVLTNKDIIALNQDPLGKAVNYVEEASKEGFLQVWAGEVKDGGVVLVFNEKSYPQDVDISLVQLGLDFPSPPHAKELWSGKDLGKKERVQAVLQPYQTLVFRLS